MPSDPSGTPLSSTALEEGSEQLPQYKNMTRSNGASARSTDPADGSSTPHVVALAGGEEFEQPPESGKCRYPVHMRLSL